MRVVRTIAELSLDSPHRWVLVPTMGAFHEGHLFLMRKARHYGDRVVVSLFVNPTQFKAGEDFAKYPRNEATDFAMAEEAGVDMVFAPAVSEMYREGKTAISVSGVSELWEGQWRPGHFEGVATVVAKLFNIIRAQVAVFGQKDFQQCAVIKQMVRDLDFSVELRFEETVREQDGLAMSSRNVYLSKEQRALAPLLYRTLTRLQQGLKDLEEEEIARRLLLEESECLANSGFSVDYLAVVDENTLMPSYNPATPRRIIVAARLGTTRLIDNISL